MAEGEVNKQVTDATTQTNVKSWHDVHMGIAASMAESHATTMAALNQSFAESMSSLGKRIVEPDVAQAISERLIGGAGQSAVQSDQVSTIANNLAQLTTVVADMKQVLGAVSEKIK